MRKYFSWLALLFLLAAGGAVLGAEPDRSRPPVPPEWIELWERVQRSLQERGGQLLDLFGGRDSREGRPLISIMLNNRERLGLSEEQVKKLESIRDNFERQSIRNDAESRIVELDIAALLDSETVDLAKAEGKIREAAKLRADLRIARLRAIEQANALLSAEQKKKLQELAPPQRPPRPAHGGANPTE
jgi:Spy/CpxP family protein refolding chaperone